MPCRARRRMACVLGLVHCNVLQPDTFHVVKCLRAVQQSCFFSRRYLRTSAQRRLNSEELASACARNCLDWEKHSLRMPHLLATVWISNIGHGAGIWSTCGKKESDCRQCRFFGHLVINWSEYNARICRDHALRNSSSRGFATVPRRCMVTNDTRSENKQKRQNLGGHRLCSSCMRVPD